MTPLDVYYCGGSQVAGMGLPVTQALPVQVNRALRERWGPALGHGHLLEYSGDPGDLERALRRRRIPHPFVLLLVPRNTYVWGIPQLGDFRRYFRGVAAMDAAVMDDVQGYMSLEPRRDPPPATAAAAAPGCASHIPLAGVRRRAWLATRAALKALWYLAWLPTLPWWALRYDVALRSLLRYARAAGCRLFVLATPVPLRAGNSWTPGLHWYVALLAVYLRTKAGGDVVVADLYRRLQGPSAEPLHFFHDRMVHLTSAGTRLAVDTVVAAIAQGVESASLVAEHA